MVRPPRQHHPGAFYHVTLRGNHRQPIFDCDADREALGDIIAAAIRQTDATIHAYCWMTNHIHAVVQVGEMPLGRLVQRVANRYARRFQQILQTTGHLFERRHHAVHVDADSQLLAAVRYVHLNPVRAGLADDPARYRWSGHRTYMGWGGPDWLTTGFVLNMLDEDMVRARRAYAQFVAEQPADTADGPVAGPGAPPANRAATPNAPADAQPPGSLGLEALIRVICADECVTETALRSKSRDRRLSAVRARIAVEAVATGAASLSDVARRFDRHITSVAKAISRRR